jgi:long-chain fatty acid transport protein
MLLRFNHLAASLALAGLANLAHGAGFALIEQNASGLGNAYAGQAAARPTPARFSSIRQA